jgi:hypothetical protein
MSQTDQIEGIKNELVSSLLVGEPLRQIVQKAWPTIDEASNPIAFNDKKNALRNGSLRLRFQRDNSRALSVSYISSDPAEAYRVVNATIDTLIDFSKSDSAEKLQTNVVFLQKELDESEKRIREVQTKLTRLKSGLPPAIVEAHQRSVDQAVQSGEPISFSANLESPVQYPSKPGESYSELKLSLAIGEKELSRMVEQLRSKSYLSESVDVDDVVDSASDPSIAAILKTLAQKEQQLTQLTSQGLREKHPSVRDLKAEIESLNQMKRDRLRQLQTESGADAKEAASFRMERKLREKIEKKEEEVTSLRDRIEAIDEFRKELPEQNIDDKISILSIQKAMLSKLETELLVSKRAYEGLANEIDLAKRRQRVQENQIGVRATVAEAPRMPQTPIPMAHLSTIVMGMIVTLGLCIGVACIISVLDTTVHTSDDLTRIVEVPVLGTIDQMVERQTVQFRKMLAVVVFSVLLVYAMSAGLIVRAIL